MPDTQVDTWEELTSQLRELQSTVPYPLLFRGLSDSDWSLTTTLERSGNLDMRMLDYYNVTERAKSQIETFTQTTWASETFQEMEALTASYDRLDFCLSGGRLVCYPYFAYLRHHGFPSPLLDWTRSQYIAAFFAFRSPVQPTSGRVSVFAYSEMPDGMKVGGSGESQIHSFGRFVRTHRRHFIQQSQYTMCLKFVDGLWSFSAHPVIFDFGQPYRHRQDVVWKFTIPWGERRKVLKLLDAHNLNALSLFESDEALLETLAFRELPPAATADASAKLGR